MFPPRYVSIFPINLSASLGSLFATNEALFCASPLRHLAYANFESPERDLPSGVPHNRSV